MERAVVQRRAKVPLVKRVGVVPELGLEPHEDERDLRAHARTDAGVDRRASRAPTSGHRASISGNQSFIRLTNDSGSAMEKQSSTTSARAICVTAPFVATPLSAGANLRASPPTTIGDD